MLTSLLTIVFIIVSCIFIWHFIQDRKFKSLHNVPGPTNYPIIGIALEFGRNSVDFLKDLSRLCNTYGPNVKGFLGPKNMYLMTTDPELTEIILSSPKYIRKSDDYNTFKPWLKNGLLVSDGSYWQKRRKSLTPAFHFKILDGFVSIFNSQIEILINKLAENVNKEVFDVYPYITACTLDIICETAMGTSVKAQTTVNHEYVNSVKKICTIIVNRSFSSWKRFDATFRFSSNYKEQKTALNVIHRFTRSVIEQRRESLLHLNQHKLKESEADDNTKRKQVFLDILLNATIDGKPLTDADIQEEVDTFMFEGHDTTASLIAFAMYELARNPDVQNKVFLEQREVYGDNKQFQTTLQDLNNLKYTELVLKETMRLYPSVPLYSRTLPVDVNYKGTVIPKDTNLLLFVFGMQRRRDLFPDPENFYPERFISKDINSNPFSYVPFSAGPRNCIGQKFAMYEAKCALSKIIMNFEILPADEKYDVVLSSEIILKSANGIHLQLKHRKFGE